MRKKILINRKALNRGEAYVLLRRGKMRMSRKGDDSSSRKVREMAQGNNKTGKADAGSGEPASQFEGTPRMADLSEGDIIKLLNKEATIQRLKQMLAKIEKETEEAKKKAEQAKQSIFAQIKQKYGATEEDIRKGADAWERKSEIIERIITCIKREGKNVAKNKTFLQRCEELQAIGIIESMSEEERRKLKIYIPNMPISTTTTTTQIHHAGRMSEDTIEILKYIHMQGGAVEERTVLQWYKETFGASSDMFNKRRWSLFQREYIERQGNQLVITEKGIERLRREGIE